MTIDALEQQQLERHHDATTSLICMLGSTNARRGIAFAMANANQENNRHGMANEDFRNIPLLSFNGQSTVNSESPPQIY